MATGGRGGSLLKRFALFSAVVLVITGLGASFLDYEYNIRMAYVQGYDDTRYVEAVLADTSHDGEGNWRANDLADRKVRLR